MANTGTYKQLPWPDNLWKELFGFKEHSEPPEDWEQALQIFMDSLSDLDQKILLAWYRDKMTGKQMQAKFKFPGVISRRVSIIKQMRSDYKNRLVYQYGWSKVRLIPGIRRGLIEKLGMPHNSADELIDEILASTTIAQAKSIEQLLSSLPFADPENRNKVESLLNEYGLSTLSSRKLPCYNFYRDLVFKDSLEIIQQLSNRDILIKRITDTLIQSITNQNTVENILSALRADNLDAFIKAFTGGDRLDLLCKAGGVKMQQSEKGALMWAVVRQADLLPPANEEVAS